MIGAVSSWSTLKGTGDVILTCAFVVAMMATAAMIVDLENMVLVIVVVSYKDSEMFESV